MGGMSEGLSVGDSSLYLELNIVNIGASGPNQTVRDWLLEETLQKGNSYQLIREIYVRGLPLKMNA